MNEDEIERRVEKMTDHLDACLMARTMSQRDYDKAIQDLNHWAQAKAERGRGYLS